MRRWWRDTLFKRLFASMWIALVASHLVAFLLVTGRLEPGPNGRGPSLADLPTLPSLPPTPGVPGTDAAASRPAPRPSDRPFPERPPPERPERGFGPPPGPPPSRPAEGRPALPPRLLALDYGVRLLVIGLMAWVAARWVSTPMRRLAEASRALGDALGRADAPAALDERRGTVEVRETARVFNEMAAALHRQFRSRGLMMAAISHDLRTPLTRMRMRLEQRSDDPASQRCIDDIREMSHLIDTVLEVFRETDGAEPAQQADVFALVQSLADDLVEQGHRIEVTGEPVVACVQPVALRRVIANLLGNAVRYGERATVTVRRNDDRVEILVDDEGPGIPPDQLESVFEPFYRVEASRSRHTGGTGLGLYIARHLTTRQGGRLTLSNRSGGGLRARLTLPAGAAPAGAGQV